MNKKNKQFKKDQHKETKAVLCGACDVTPQPGFVFSSLH